MPADIVSFLRARLDRLEAAALAEVEYQRRLSQDLVGASLVFPPLMEIGWADPDFVLGRETTSPAAGGAVQARSCLPSNWPTTTTSSADRNVRAPEVTLAPDTPTTDTISRPGWACALHTPPRRPGAWVPADTGYRTCSSCLDRLRDQLKEIPARYRILNATPGSSGDRGTRGAPGFGSRSPASDHIIAMRDPRSDRTATCWRGQDKRFHQEPERPVLSVFAELDLIAWHIVETRGLEHGPERPTVADTARFIDNHLDWLTRQDDIADHAKVIADLTQQLRPVTGEPGRRHIGHCPNTVTDDGDTTRECGAKLYAPLGGSDTIVCRQCSREWPRSEWLRLGLMLDAS